MEKWNLDLDDEKIYSYIILCEELYSCCCQRELPTMYDAIEVEDRSEDTYSIHSCEK